MLFLIGYSLFLGRPLELALVRGAIIRCTSWSRMARE